MSKGADLEQVQAAIEHATQAWAQKFEEQMVRQNQSLGGVLLRGAQAVQVGGAAGATARPSTSAGSVVGYSLRETAGAVAVVRIFDGPDANGQLVAAVNLAANGSAGHWWGPGGVGFTGGLFVSITGAVEGAVFLRGPE